MSLQRDADAPSCPNCASGKTEQIEGGSDAIYRCLDCGTEFDSAGNRLE